VREADEKISSTGLRPVTKEKGHSFTENAIRGVNSALGGGEGKAKGETSERFTFDESGADFPEKRKVWRQK